MFVEVKNDIKKCMCGGMPEFIKLYDRFRYDGFLKCPACGREGRTCVSKQAAVKSWNRAIDKCEKQHNPFLWLEQDGK